MIGKGCIPQLIFEAEHVWNNPNDEDAKLRGVFCYQKKSKNDTWEKVDAESLTKLKAGEGVKLQLRSAETLKLYRHLHGELAKNRDIEKLVAEMLQRLNRDDYASLDLSALSSLQASIQLALLSGLLKEFKSSLVESTQKEEYWQTLLSKNHVILEQLFDLPIVVANEKAYVGGKQLNNSEGKVVDFIVRNRVTKNASLVEIKTPQAKLLGSSYRQGVFPLSTELSGAISQVLTYRDSLLKSFNNLGDKTFESFEPQCVVVVGYAEKELDTQDKRRSFELCRAQLTPLRIVTFDEIQKKLEFLVSLLQGSRDEVHFDIDFDIDEELFS